MSMINEPGAGMQLDTEAMGGELKVLREVLINKLIDCGWEAEMKLACMRIIKSKGVENVNVDSLIKDLTPIGREKVPAEIKKELLERIKATLTKQAEENNI